MRPPEPSPLVLTRQPTPHEVRAISVEADVHPVTTLAVLAGKPTRPSTRARVLRVLVSLGFLPAASVAPIPTTPRPMLDGSAALDLSGPRR